MTSEEEVVAEDDFDVTVELDSERCLRLRLLLASSSCMLVDVVEWLEFMLMSSLS